MKLPIFSKNHAADGGDLFLVVGLGNPGEDYANTRHNIGFMAVREFSRSLEDPDKARRRYSGKWREGWFGGRRLATLLPHTFMNRSGEAVHQAASRKHVPPDRIIIVHDDMDFPFGTVRARLGGGSGGHRGLDSITRKLGTADYARVRIGIGRPDDPDEDVRDWVLAEFAEDETQLRPVIAAAADCIAAIINEGVEAAMNRFNRRDE
ncbi:MAG: aminoacyl-tRNA hydrolase [Thermoleophilia bacterium]